MEKAVILKRGKEESLQRFHPWIFSGAIQRIEGKPEEGDVVTVYTNDRQFIARGHVQVGSIAVRILTFKDEPVEGEDAHGNAAHLYVSARYELMVVGVYCHNIALLGFALNALDGAREYPGVEALQ